MDLPSPHQVPSGPMTRARARALETEVTSLLSLHHFDSHETWLLPSSETLCILRHLGSNHGEVKGQEESKEEEGGEEQPRLSLPGRSGRSPGRSGRGPDDPDKRPDDPANVPEDTRSSTPKPDHPDPCPDHPDTPGHPDEDPDIRATRSRSGVSGSSAPPKPGSSGQTSGSSGQCLRA